jgi:transposase
MNKNLNNGFRPYFRSTIAELIALSKKETSNKKIIDQIVFELSHRKTSAAKNLLIKLRNPESESNINLSQTIKRPYISFNIKQLSTLFEERKTDKKIKDQIVFELTHRKRRAAKNLLAKIRNPDSQSKINLEEKIRIRPYFSYSTKELKNLSEYSKTDKKILDQVISELLYRKTNIAKKLFKELTNKESIKEDFEEIIISINDENLTKDEILAKFNLLPSELSDIQRKAKKLGVEIQRLPRVSQSLSEKEKKILEAINEKNLTKDEILAKFNLSLADLYGFQRKAKKLGFEIKRLNRISQSLSEKEKKILELRKVGQTLEEIAAPFDVTRERIRQILARIKKKGFDVPKTAGIVKKTSAAKKNKQIIEDQIKSNSDHFIKEYRKNLSDKDTAKNLELSLKNFRTVVEIFIKEGRMNRRLKIFDEKQYIKMKKEWDEIAAMRKAGYSNQKIASILDTSIQMISIKIERMKTNGYHISPYGKMADRDYSTDHDEETLAYRTKVITELNNQGLSKSQIAKKLGISSRDLYRHIGLYMINY